jgi:hypothetical protein
MALMMLAVALAACDPTSTDPDPTVTVPLETSTTTAAATTTTAAVDEVPDCLAGTLPFAEQGIVAALDSPQHDATTIGGIRWQPDEGCERVLIEFLTEGGSPATRLGPVGVTVAPDTGIVRISLPEAVEASAIGDSLISGPLVDHIYVVEGITDGLVVDVHLAARAAARAFTTTSPSRLIIDLRPTSDVPIGSAPDNGGRVVVSSPLPGPSLYPLQVAGYAAPGVDAVRIMLSADDQTALERSVSTVTDRHLWRAFAVTISDGPSGLVQVRVTDDAATDDGVVVELDLP